MRIYVNVHFVTKIQRYEIWGWGKGIHYKYLRGWALGLGVSLNQAALCYTIGTDKSDYVAAG